MTAWLNLPDLEAKLDEMNRRKPDVSVLQEAVAAISAATDRVVKTEIWTNGRQSRLFTAQTRVGPKLVLVKEVGYCFDPTTFNDRRVETYNCEVIDGRYVAHVQSGRDRRQEDDLPLEKLAWRCCGFLFTPREVRAASERAKTAGFKGPIPLRYLSDKSR